MCAGRPWCTPLGAAFLLLASGRALATERFGPVQLSGNLQTQNLVRHPDASTFQFIQNRNTAHLKLEYAWLRGGKFYDRYEIPFLERSDLFLLYRGVYDSIYDTTPNIIEKEDGHGRTYGGLDLFQFSKSV